MTKPRAYCTYDLPYADYAVVPAINSTALKAGRTSIKHMHAAMQQNVHAGTPAMQWGRKIHSAVLEPDRYFAEVVTFEGRRAGAAWDLVKAAHPADAILKPDEMVALNAISNSVHANQHAHRLIEQTRHEVCLFFCGESMGACKCRLDGYSGEIGIVELKSTRNIDKTAFARQFVNKAYDIQMGWYSGAVYTVLGDELDGNWPTVHMIVVESLAPYDCIVYRIPDALLEKAYERAIDIARMYRIQEHLGRYEGISDEILDFELPPWADGGQRVELTMGGEAVQI